MKLNIIKVGLTFKQKGEVSLIVEGELPPDCVVVFMDKESWNRLKEELNES